MEKFYLQKTSFSPEIILDPNANLFKIAGESRPENVPKFYAPVFNWFESYLAETSEEKNLQINLQFNYDYFNSTTAKVMLDLINLIKNLSTNKLKLVVTWFYEGMDDDIFDSGKELERLTQVKFKFIEK